MAGPGGAVPGGLDRGLERPTELRSRPVPSAATERGSAGIGLALGATCLVIIMMFGVGALRLTSANGEVSAASRSAARAAVNAYDPIDGRAAAESMAVRSLDGRGGVCHRIEVEAEGSWEPGGQVTVTVTCTVRLEGLTLAGFDVERTVGHRATEIVDRFRGGADR